MIPVKNNNIKAALRTMKRRSSDKLHELRNRQEYKKPSEVRKQAKNAAKYREQLRQNAKS